jgi:hypothetical protein
MQAIGTANIKTAQNIFEHITNDLSLYMWPHPHQRDDVTLLVLRYAPDHGYTRNDPENWITYKHSGWKW